MARTLKNLALALLNATLILLALCLFLAWKAASTLNDIAGNFAASLEIVEPLTDEARALRSDIQALTAELGSLRDAGDGNLVSGALANRVEALDARITGLQAQVTDLRKAPAALIDHTIETAADQAVRGISRIRGCSPPAV